MATQIQLVPKEFGQSSQTFAQGFTIGRDQTCGLPVDSPLASRVHAAVSLEDGAWWAVDLGSTNGIFINGARVERERLVHGSVLQIGRGGPEFEVVLIDAPDLTKSDSTKAYDRGGQAAEVTHKPSGSQSPSPGPGDPVPTPPKAADKKPRIPRPFGSKRASSEPAKSSMDSPPAAASGKTSGLGPSSAHSAGAGSSGSPPESMTQVMKRYFDEGDGGEAGEHTRMIRQAYTKAKKRDRKPLVWGVGALLVALVATGMLLRQQRKRVAGLEAQAQALFVSMRQNDVTLSNFRRALEGNSGTTFQAQLADLERQRNEQREQYEGYVEQLGFYRRMKNDKERAIYRMARTFGESEFSMSGDFVRAVESEIENYWLTASGRARFRQAVERGESGGLTPVITDALKEAGLPIEFYYLALQESDLKRDAVGPLTRFGRAKGMWQFIPVTAARYGLDPGPLPNSEGTGVQDDRLNFRLASPAAANYLRDIYAELAQASGLLVMAAYNWGEHRVNPRLQNLDSPEAVFEAEFADVGQSPEERNYWLFLEQYGERMPDETKDYVLKIFSAAVLGTNPEAFGFDASDPLASYRGESAQ